MMKKVINTFLTNIFQVYAKRRLPDSIEHHLPYDIPYISQFMSIQPANLQLNSILDDPILIEAFGAKDAKEFNFWMFRDCGIACVQMILKHENKAQDKSMMDLTREGINLGGYILYNDKGEFVDKGWLHRSLVELLKKYTLSASMKKWQSAESVARDVLQNRNVILSMHLPTRGTIREDGSFEPKQNPSYSGHLVLVIGVTIKNKEIQGFIIHDPRGLEKYQANTFLPIKAFHKAFSHRTIVVHT